MDLGLREMSKMMRSPAGAKQLLKKPVFEDENGEKYSQAQIVADVINVMRIDNKRLGRAKGLDITAAEMTEERAAEILVDMIQGDSIELVDAFNELEDQRNKILEEELDESEYEKHIEMKKQMSYTGGD